MAHDALETFLRPLKPETIGEDQWSSGIRLRIASYLSDRMPPTELITSVRAVVFTKSGVAVLHNPEGFHIIPGGRREPGESMIDTLRREVLEETGCSVERAQLLGFRHLRHLTPRPKGYRYPYPDFIQLVYGVEGRVVAHEVSDPDGWEERVEFVQVDELTKRPLAPEQRQLLEKALELFG